MATKFKGSIDELKRRVEKSGFAGTWSGDTQGKYSLRIDAGGVLNWWPSTGTIQIQGASLETKNAIEIAIAERKAEALAGVPQKAVVDARQIFIVHGHDGTARDQLELALRRLGLEPFVLMNTSGEGKTLIEALEGKIGRDYSSDFGIVLMTPDDVGYSKNDGADRAEPRARQNVILETGMLLSSLTRARIAIVVKGHVEIPSDLQGIIRFNYNDHIREIVPKLCQRLKEVGFDLNPGQIAAASQ